MSRLRTGANHCLTNTESFRCNATHLGKWCRYLSVPAKLRPSAGEHRARCVSQTCPRFLQPCLRCFPTRPLFCLDVPFFFPDVPVRTPARLFRDFRADFAETVRDAKSTATVGTFVRALEDHYYSQQSSGSENRFRVCSDLLPGHPHLGSLKGAFANSETKSDSDTEFPPPTLFRKKGRREKTLIVSCFGFLNLGHMSFINV